MAATSDGIPKLPKISDNDHHTQVLDATTSTENIRNKFKSSIGIIFCVLLFSSSFLGTIFMLTPVLILLPIKPTWYRLISDEVLSSWFIFVVALLEEVIGMKVTTCGDIIRVDEPCLIIMNHRTRLDWLFFFLCLMKRGSVLREKIILKSDLKGIPGAGWAMQQACFMFIHRKWQTDQIILKQILDYFRQSKYLPQILLFPEGTDFSEKTKVKSDEYAKQHGLPQYEYVLHPRTTGFTFLAEYLRNGNLLDAVYDVSVAYPQSLVQNELQVLKGHFPEAIHFNVRRHAADTLPRGEPELGAWCQRVWRGKERELAGFYEHGQFECDGAGAERGWSLRVMLCVWAGLHALWLGMLAWCPAARWYLLISVCLYSGMYYGFGGLERVEMMCYGWREGRKRDE